MDVNRRRLGERMLTTLALIDPFHSGRDGLLQVFTRFPVAANRHVDSKAVSCVLSLDSGHMCRRLEADAERLVSLTRLPRVSRSSSAGVASQTKMTLGMGS